MGTEEQRYRGVIHAHTTFSYDGQVDIADLAEILKEKKLDFAFLTEHAKGFTATKYAEYATKCRELSSDNFLMVPGLEYDFELEQGRSEVILVGSMAYFDAKSLDDLWEHKASHGGVSILPHPLKFISIPVELLNRIDLIEVWNRRFDGGLFPPQENLDLLERRNSECVTYGMCGVDFHERDDPLDLITVITADSLEADSLLGALAQGRYHTRYRGISLAADLKIPTWLRVCGAGGRMLRKGIYSVGKVVVRSPLAKGLVPVGLRKRIRNFLY